MNPNSFKFACPKCGQHLSADVEHAGQSISCPGCAEWITVPKPLALEPSSPQPAQGQSPQPAPGYRPQQAGGYCPPAAYGGQMTSDKPNPKGLVLAAWLLMGVTCLVALIPGIGFVTWIIAVPILLVTFVLGVVALSKGATVQGVLILLASVIVAPLFLVLAPIITLAVFAAGASSASSQGKAPPSASAPSSDRIVETDGGGTPSAGGSKGIATIGDEIRFPDSTWVVLSARELGSTLRGGLLDESKSTEGRFIYVRFKVTNLGKEEDSILFAPAVRDAQGRRFEELDTSEVFLPDGETGMTMEPLPPSLPRAFSAIFEVAKDSAGIMFLARSLGFDKSEKAVALKLEESAVREAKATRQAEIVERTRRADAEEAKEKSDAEVREANRAAEERKAKERLAELKGELATVNAKIASEKARWQAATDTINRLTNFKRTPVREGSPQYFQCLEASKIIQEVEAGANELKTQKARLEAVIQELEK